jgi:ABC-type multidrug transport system fused ATPase/permease subunit
MGAQAEARSTWAADDGQEWRWLWTQLRPYIHYAIGSLVLVLLATALWLVSPLLMKWLIDVILPQRAWRALVLVTLLFFAAISGGNVMRASASLVATRGVLKCTHQLRRRLLGHLIGLPAAFYAKHPVGDLVQRAETDVSLVADLGSDLLPGVVNLVVQTGMTIAIMVMLDWRLTLMLLPLTPLFEWLRRRYRTILRQNSEDLRGASGMQSSLLTELITGIIQIQLLGAERRMARNYARLNLRSQRARWTQKRNEVLFSVLVTTVIALGSAIIIGYGGARVMNGELTAGTLVAFYSYIGTIFAPLSMATELYARVNRVRASIRRLLDIERMPNAIRDRPDATPLIGRPRLIVCTGVTFRYDPDKPALDRTDFDARAGEPVAIVGASGCGKSSLLKLLPRLYDVEEGRIEIDGHDIRGLQLRTLRAAISFVPQEPILFQGTLRENLRHGCPTASAEDLHRAIDIACLTDVVHRLPDGLMAHLGPMGGGLSGGEKQRVAIARAILQDRPIVILDEATSALDARTEQRLLGNLRRWCADRIVIVVSHRLTAPQWADRAVVFDAGRVIEDGSHDGLFQPGTFYFDLWDSAGRSLAASSEEATSRE